MRWIAALAVTLVLAGCSAPAEGSDGVTQADDRFDDLDLKATSGKGVIRGVVVDDSIRPVAGADVVLGDGLFTSASDAEGRFGFSDVEPGLHFLTAGKPGYSTTQASVEVAADVEEPRVVTVLISRIPGSEPRVTMYEWNGFMQCSLIAAGAFATGCLLGDLTDDDSRHVDAIEGAPSFLQTEVVWQPTQVLGTSFCLRQYSYGNEDGRGSMLADDVCGESPLAQQVGPEALAEHEVGRTAGIERVVWVAAYGAEQGPGLALNQRFDSYTAVFYNIVPDPAWRFAIDGPYPV